MSIKVVLHWDKPFSVVWGVFSVLLKKKTVFGCLFFFSCSIGNKKHFGVVWLINFFNQLRTWLNG